jgi:Phycobilisome protein
MFTQLSRLAIETDGRYASAEELRFLKDYVQSAPQRVQAYKNVRDQEAFLIEELHNQVKSDDASSLIGNISSTQYNERDFSYMFKRDQKNMFRIVAAAMLFSDLEFLREGLLLWHRTLIKAFRLERPTRLACKFWPQVLDRYLLPDECKVLSPFVGLVRAILG